ncbi:MAG: hypothetical protein F6K19_07840 [Cyanothece sp. SIO1E1]|nr:hypothetical protein [Cyanothece sp. SIO1E1]
MHRSFPGSKQIFAFIAGVIPITVNMVGLPALAADPFRPEAPRAIDDTTAAAFTAMFKEGDYQAARNHLQQVQSGDPLAHAMQASLAYIDTNWQVLSEQATLTREAAEQLVAVDPLRGHLYTAVGHFLEGAYVLKTEGTIKAAPTALSKLQKVFDSLDAAAEISAEDPELNLLKGYMDLMLAVNLPFSDPAQAIARLENYAGPTYLAQRGIAIGYRDLRQPDQAMTAVTLAMEAAQDNPDLFYLKAQILVRQENDPASLEFFNLALAQKDQLPDQLVQQIAYEHCRAEERIDNTDRDCRAISKQVAGLIPQE